MISPKGSFLNIDKEKLERKLGYLLGLEMAAKKIVEELKPTNYFEVGKQYEESKIFNQIRLSKFISLCSMKSKVRLNQNRIEEIAKETTEKTLEVIKIYTKNEVNTLEDFEMICLSENGKVISHTSYKFYP